MTDILDAKTATIHRFGKFQIYVTPVALETGASYEIPGIPDFNDKTANKQWKGKRKVANSPDALRHVVMTLAQKSREGEEYLRAKDYLNSDAWYKKSLLPSLRSANVTVGKTYFVEVEETESGKFYNDKAIVNWKVARAFPNEDDMRKAETEYFAKFAEAAAAEKEMLDIPESETWTAETWPAVAEDFQKACDDLTGKPDAVKATLAAKVASDYSVPVSFVLSHVK